MKARFSSTWLLTGAVSLLPVAAALAQEPAAQLATPAPAVVASTTVKLPYGVEDVLKLSRAQINEDIILNYVQNSGTIYNLGPNDLVYLREQGVSDRLVNAMLDQRKRANEAAQVAQAAQAAQPAQPAYAPAPTMDPSIANGTAYTQPAASDSATYVQQPASSVYVIPYPAARSAYYSYGYPYSYGYGYYAPSVAFSIGFGGRGCYSSYHGHYGGHYGGGHSGGHWGGHH